MFCGWRYAAYISPISPIHLICLIRPISLIRLIRLIRPKITKSAILIWYFQKKVLSLQPQRNAYGHFGL